MVDVDALAKEHSMPKCANVMLLGAAARYLNILSVEELRESIARVFGTKGGRSGNEPPGFRFGACGFGLKVNGYGTSGV